MACQSAVGYFLAKLLRLTSWFIAQHKLAIDRLTIIVLQILMQTDCWSNNVLQSLSILTPRKNASSKSKREYLLN